MASKDEAAVGLIAALAAARVKYRPLKASRTAKIKTRDGSGEYSYHYADLADVLASVAPALAEAGIALTQPLRPAPEGLELVTRLVHVSGESLESVLPVPLPAGNWQAWGSALSYARRYSLTALLGVQPEMEDDDGQNAQPAAYPERRPEPKPAPQPADPSLAQWREQVAHLAAEVAAASGGKVGPADAVKAASAFEKDGKEKSFSDPARTASVRWLQATADRLKRQLETAQVVGEVADDDVPF